MAEQGTLEVDFTEASQLRLLPTGFGGSVTLIIPSAGFPVESSVQQMGVLADLEVLCVGF